MTTRKFTIYQCNWCPKFNRVKQLCNSCDEITCTDCFCLKRSKKMCNDCGKYHELFKRKTFPQETQPTAQEAQLPAAQEAQLPAAQEAQLPAAQEALQPPAAGSRIPFESKERFLTPTKTPHKTTNAKNFVRRFNF